MRCLRNQLKWLHSNKQYGRTAPLNVQNPMLLKAQAMGLSPPEVTSPLVAGRLGRFIDT